MAAFDAALGLCMRGCAPRLVEEIRYGQALAYDQHGDLARAIVMYRESINAFDRLRGRDHLGSLRRRLNLADALRRSGRPDEAAAVIAEIKPSALEALPAPHLVVADYKRMRGLLLLDRDPGQAHGQLAEALKIVESRLGEEHPRSGRVRVELGVAIHRMGGISKTDERTGGRPKS